jgi:hypothetical protein
MWVPVIESGECCLHLPTQRSEFERLINILRSPGEKMSGNQFQRKNQIDTRMKKGVWEHLAQKCKELLLPEW